MQQSNASSESRGQIRNEQRRLSDHEPSLVLAVAATVIRRRRHTPHRLLQSAAAGLTCSSETDRRPAASGGGVATAHGPTGQLLYVLRRRRRLPPTHEYTTNGETRRHLIRYERVDRWHARRTKWEGKKKYLWKRSRKVRLAGRCCGCHGLLLMGTERCVSSGRPCLTHIPTG